MCFIKIDDPESQKMPQALSANPDLKEGTLERTDITEASANQLKRGAYAEDAVIQAIREIDALLLQEWTQSKVGKVAKRTEEQPGVRMDEKKINGQSSAINF